MWRKRPTLVEYFPWEATHVVFLDENGDSDMSYLIKCKEKGMEVNTSSRYFGLTSVIISREDFGDVQKAIIDFKNKYWKPDGCFEFSDGVKKVCLHSREIRRGTGPFSKSVIKDHDAFMEDLSLTIQSLPISLTSAFIDKEKLYNKYKRLALSPYDLATTFVLERLVKGQLKDTDKAIIVLESRGKGEDAKLLSDIINLLDYGTDYVSKKQFSKIIGVYFNPKRCPNNCEKSYYGLEIADLCAYPIFSYCRGGKTSRPFNLLKTKIYGFPYCKGYGIKIFP